MRFNTRTLRPKIHFQSQSYKTTCWGSLKLSVLQGKRINILHLQANNNEYTQLEHYCVDLSENLPFIPCLYEKFSYFLNEIIMFFKNLGKFIADVQIPYVFWQHRIYNPWSQHSLHHKNCWEMKLQEMERISKTTACVKQGICVLSKVICHNNPS